MLQVYDRVLASGSVPTLVFLTLVVIGLTLANGLLENVRSKIMVRLGKSLDFQLADTLFTGLFSNQKEPNAAKTTRPLSDMSTVRNFLTGPGLIHLFDAPWTPIYLCAHVHAHRYPGRCTPSNLVGCREKETRDEERVPRLGIAMSGARQGNVNPP